MRKVLAVALLTVILINGCKGTPTLPPEPYSPNGNSAQFVAVRTHIRRLVDDGKVPSMAVAVAKNGEIIWEEAFGYADRKHHVMATEHTPYPLASISKPLTATGLMILVERGLLNLVSPINDYIDDGKLQARVGDADEATIHRVASHTAGLALHAQHFYAGETDQAPAMDVTLKRYGNIITAPGERYQYSNLGYGILSYIIGHLHNQSIDSEISYADFMSEEVFIPLGMSNTFVHLGPGLKEGTAQKYTPDGLLVPPSISDNPGASAVYSSVHDLIRFAMFHLKNDLPYQDNILNRASIDKMQCPSPETSALKAWEHAGSGYGIGWFIGVTADGLRVIYHTGGTLGVGTALALVPEENIAVAVLSNTNSPYHDEILIETLCTLLARNIDEFLPQADNTVGKAQFDLPRKFIGLWRGHVHTYDGKVALALEIDTSGEIYATLGEQTEGTLLEKVSYQTNSLELMNAGGGPFLRGWVQSKFETSDTNRGKPVKLMLELKLRENILNGALIAFSQRALYTGPLSYWVELERE